MPLYDYKCNTCNNVTEVIASYNTKSINCTKCNGKSFREFSPNKASFIGDSSKSFNPHYDMQLGKWFESESHKKQFLKDTGRVQTEGPLSPRETSKGRVICSKKQAELGEGRTAITKKKDGKYVDRISGNTHQ